MPNIGDIIMHNKAILHQIDRKTQTVDAITEIRAPAPLEEDAKKGRSCAK